MTRYVLNSAVLPGPGTYRYDVLDYGQAKRWLSQEYVSALRYEKTADAIALLFDITRPSTSREFIDLQPGDEALVFRLKMSLDTLKKITLTSDFIAKNSEIGLLRRLV